MTTYLHADDPRTPEHVRPAARVSRMAEYQRQGIGLLVVDGRMIADELPEGAERTAVEEWANTILAAEMAKPHSERQPVTYTPPF